MWRARLAEGCIYTGDELAKMSSSAFRHAVLECNAFARVSPEQKFSIIQVLKEQEIVGYQGDGINDAPALRLADVAIAVDSATDVAKASADIILLDKDLGVIINAIRYGRMIFANINKYIKYTMVGNFGNFFALSLLYLLATTLPLLPRQVLLISLLTDLPLIAISTDAVSSDDLQQPSRYSASALLSISLVLGSVTALAELVFFATVLGQTTSTRSTSLYLFLTFTQLIVILSVRNQGHFWKAAAPSRLLLGAITLTGVIAVAIPYLRPTARLFTFNAPTPQEVGIILLITVLYVLVLDMVKVWYYKKADSSGKLRLQWLSRRRRMSLLP
jgi:Mg2+-importing ATPase